MGNFLIGKDGNESQKWLNLSIIEIIKIIESISRNFLINIIYSLKFFSLTTITETLAGVNLSKNVFSCHNKRVEIVIEFQCQPFTANCSFFYGDGGYCTQAKCEVRLIWQQIEGFGCWNGILMTKAFDGVDGAR